MAATARSDRRRAVAVFSPSGKSFRSGQGATRPEAPLDEGVESVVVDCICGARARPGPTQAHLEAGHLGFFGRGPETPRWRPYSTNNASVCGSGAMGPERATRGKGFELGLGPRDVHAWSIPLDGLDDAGFSSGALSAEERARASRFRFPADRRRFARAHAGARAILGAYLGVEPADVAIVVDEAGKPRLDPQRHPMALRFNLAHSHGLAVLAVSYSEIGIDLEFQRSPTDSDAVVRRYFSRNESAAYFALPRALRAGAFFAAWTLKEAYLKACGDGLRRRLDSFSVTMRPDEPPRLLAVPDRPGEVTRWRLLRLAPRAGYVGAVAMTRCTARVREWEWSGRIQ